MFEGYYDIAGAPLWTGAYFVDTIKDLIDDMIGGAIVAWVLFRKIKQNDSET